MRCMFTLGLALILPGLIVAGDSEETPKSTSLPYGYLISGVFSSDSLCPLLAKSDVVAVGTFATEPVVKKGNADLHNYLADFRITQLIKWDTPGQGRVGATIKVNVQLLGAERPPELQKGGQCLLFLKCYDRSPNPSYLTSDFWFGIQRSNPDLTRALANIVTAQQKTPLFVPTEKDIERFYPDLVRGWNSFKDFKVDKADLLKIFRDYQVVSKHDWKHGYSHVPGGDRTGTIIIRDGTRIEYMVRPGGLATLTFPDGRTLYLAHKKSALLQKDS